VHVRSSLFVSSSFGFSNIIVMLSFSFFPGFVINYAFCNISNVVYHLMRFVLNPPFPVFCFMGCYLMYWFYFPVLSLQLAMWIAVSAH
jgi:hypothetical protein